MTASQISPSIFDHSNLANIKRDARTNDPKALKAAAQQFEALFAQMMLKSMREATPRESMFDSDQTKMYESLLDQQLSQSLTSGRGMGLAAMIERQLSRSDATPEPMEGPLPFVPPAPSFSLDGGKPLKAPANASLPMMIPLPMATTASGHRAGSLTPPAQSNPVPVPPATAATSGTLASDPASVLGPLTGPMRDDPVARDFVSRLWPEAVQVSRETGIPPHFMIAHAALETGWGRSEPRRADGAPSFNLFGVKAGKKWSGEAVTSATTEYVDGQLQKTTDRFRSYGSYAEAFRDYADLLKTNPRYADALGAQDATSFARALQKGGYATDPNYAVKLARIISGPTLRGALA